MKLLSLRPLTAALLLFALGALAACNPAPAAEDQDKDWLAAEEMVETSDRVLVAQLVGEATEVVEVNAAGSGPAAGEKEILYNQFEVVESLKGTSDADDTFWMAFDPALEAELFDGSGDPRPLAMGETYVLFLKGRAKPPPYPDYGPVLWTGNGQPSLAVLRGESLQLLADDVYLDLLRRQEIETASPDSAAPFTLTLPQLRELTD